VNRWSRRVTLRKHRARSQARGFRRLGPEGDRAFAEAFRRAQQAAQAEPFRSAMSMLVFYMNRAGKGSRQRDGLPSKARRASFESCSASNCPYPLYAAVIATMHFESCAEVEVAAASLQRPTAFTAQVTQLKEGLLHVILQDGARFLAQDLHQCGK
jgi:hypothetical protein